MSKFIVVDGDTVIFDTQFLHHTVIGPLQDTIPGTGHATVSGKKVCVGTDYKKVSLSAVKYTSGPYVTPGDGTLTIQALQADQTNAWCLSDQPVITVGSKFIAFFKPDNPAKTPQGVPDPMIPAVGTGSFQSINTWVTAG
ncbi:hypothetical protein P8971_23635 [Serratia marcescens]|uniref:hypothetical protein n=1 Tax=Serratia marcescens TaxID=615 RepID=UPI0032049582